MEEKRYPELNEEQDIDMCCEPAAEAVGNAPTSVNGVTKVHDWIDDLDWMAKIEWEDEAKLMFRQLVKNARLGYKNESQSFD